MKYFMLVALGFNLGAFVASLQPACGVNPWQAVGYTTVAAIWTAALWSRR